MRRWVKGTLRTLNKKKSASKNEMPMARRSWSSEVKFDCRLPGERVCRMMAVARPIITAQSVTQTLVPAK